jgi:hypothetical protein
MLGPLRGSEPRRAGSLEEIGEAKGGGRPPIGDGFAIPSPIHVAHLFFTDFLIGLKIYDEHGKPDIITFS